jgi:hypothetical protein
MMRKTYYILFALILSFTRCRENYDPPVNSLPDSFLVVEGVLNVGSDSTTIHLTRTFELDQRATVKTENNAHLTVEGKDNTTSFLFGAGKGNYVSANLNLVANREYRLRIKTSDGKEYLSDYVKAKLTPAIDSISWRQDDKGVQIYANTHDPLNDTKYYRWEYEETWEIRSHMSSSIIYENGVIRRRIFPQEDVSVCWKYQSSTDILLANSLRLGSDLISQAPLVLIPDGTEKLGVRYSILVRQYALEEGAYNFFELMKKNTENIGSLFTPQPSELRGNIHCVSNPAEYVVGYVTASTIVAKRIFISAAEVPRWPYIIICPAVSVPSNRDSIDYAVNTLGLMPVYSASTDYIFSTPECVDCTTRGGSIRRPFFW